MLPILWFCAIIASVSAKRSFTIDYQNHTFLKDGKPFTYYAGEIHYFRVRPELWEDRLQRIRAMGLNAIQTYVAWNWHETYEGKIDFERPEADLFRFIKLAQKHNLYVILRAGPYACAEWEAGGLPYWLLNKPGIQLRVYNEPYINAVNKFYRVLLPRIKPLLYINGGPILSVQIENEYGSYGCDHKYLQFLRDLFHKHLGPDVLLFTTDSADYETLKCGTVEGVFPTVDFRPTNDSTVASFYEIQKNVSKGGPFVNSECYPGWFKLWGAPDPKVPTTSQVLNTMTAMANHGGSFSLYMVHGGTNFGFWNGASRSGPVITSYDYGAPITENGGITPAYLEIRKWISDRSNVSLPPVPKNNTVRAYGKLKLKQPFISANILNSAFEKIGQCKRLTDLLSFEEMDHPYGFVAYETTLRDVGTNLTAPNLKDHGYVFVDGVFQGVLVNNLGDYHSLSLTLKNVVEGSSLAIIVENRGRLNFAMEFESLIDRKGLLPDVFLDGQKLTKWDICRDTLDKLSHETSNGLTSIANGIPGAFNITNGAGVFIGEFTIDGEIADTWLNPKGFRKGQVLINGFNLGRYWTSAGPQVTLYLPAPLLRRQNRIILVELLGQDSGFCQDTIEFTDRVISASDRAAELRSS
uniref:Beta-galactosidase n=1 Tax=Panagrellus redivivus TaxID=6233 RepID=A0A7E4V4C8_PANRE